MGGVLDSFCFFYQCSDMGRLAKPFSMDCIATALLFGLVGFIDDYLKIKKQNSDGLSRRQKLLAQTIGTLLICFGY